MATAAPGPCEGRRYVSSQVFRELNLVNEINLAMLIEIDVWRAEGKAAALSPRGTGSFRRVKPRSSGAYIVSYLSTTLKTISGRSP